MLPETALAEFAWDGTGFRRLITGISESGQEMRNVGHRRSGGRRWLNGMARGEKKP